MTLPGIALAVLLAATASAQWKTPLRGANTKPTITEQDVRDFAAFGGKLLRITCNTRPFVDKQAPYRINEDNLRLIDNILDWGEKYRVRVIIDPHTTPGTARETTTSPNDQLWTDFAWHDHLIRMWDHVARRYTNRGDVIAGYDLLNEPALPNSGEAGTPADWNLLVAKLVKTIRAVDQRHTIVIEPPVLRSKEGKWTNRLLGFTHLAPPPDHNVVYSPHMYEPHKFTHQGIGGNPEGVRYPGVIEGRQWNRDAIEAAMQPVRDFQKKYGVTVFMGEFSAPRYLGADANQYVQDVIEVCEKFKWSWAYHAYREASVWDAERDNFDRTQQTRKDKTPRLDLLKSFWTM
jgi:aryl-phospho-beta-D-glucosidase BglC (GH1 family)